MIAFQVVRTRNEACRVCGHLINLDRVRLNCKKGMDCPYYGRAADRVAMAVHEWAKRLPDEWKK